MPLSLPGMTEENKAEADMAGLAARLVNHSNRNIFLTGKAGTGKTTFLRKITELTHKKTAIAAPTGIAAINAGGVTIHSLFQLPFGAFIPENIPEEQLPGGFRLNTPKTINYGFQMGGTKRNLLRELELLIIDEVSMLRADLLDAINERLKTIRGKNHLPFGGVQLLFIGDLLQLPPVVKHEEWSVLKNYYASAFFFDARVLREEKPIYVELDKIYRQSDERFVFLLNNLRNNVVTSADIELLNTFYKPDFVAPEGENFIILTTHNVKANEINSRKLNALNGEKKISRAEKEGDFNENAYPADEQLELKKGAQVMFIKNDPSGQQKFFNGKIGVVSGFTKDEVLVKCEGEKENIVVKKFEWENIQYTLNKGTNEIEENILGTYKQFPLRLAWAITVHKSQGLTFDKAVIDVGAAFAPGQVYVALSRLRSLNGLVLTSKINTGSLRQDEMVNNFSRTKELQGQLDLIERNESAAYLRSYLLKSYDLSDLYFAFQNHLSTYNPHEKKSLRKKFSKQMDVLFAEFQNIKPVADKFLTQVGNVIDNRAENFLDHLNERIKAAQEYFEPAMEKISSELIKIWAGAAQEKKSKEYTDELIELETAFYEKRKQMKKAVVFARNIREGKEFTRYEIKDITSDTKRETQLREALRKENEKKLIRDEADDEAPVPKAVSYIKEKKAPKEKSAGKKTSKAKTAVSDEVAGILHQHFPELEPSSISSQDLSIYLFKAGKSLEEICELRNFARSTITSHLLKAIENNLIRADEIFDIKKLEFILAEAKNFEGQNMSPLKEHLGPDFSYDEIRGAFIWEKINAENTG